MLCPAAVSIAASLPPGPSAPPALLMTRFLLRPTQFLDGCYRRYGDFFTVETPERTVCFLADPEAIKQIFTGDPELLHAGEGNAILAPMLGPRSVLVLDGPEHMRQRRLMLPSFHGERMASYGELMAEVAEREVAEWPSGRPFAVLPSMQAITL